MSHSHDTACITACSHGSDGVMHGLSLFHAVSRRPGGAAETNGSRWRGCSVKCRGHGRPADCRACMHGSKCRTMACFHGSDGAMHGRSLPYGVPRHPGGSGEPSGSRWRGCSATCRGHKGGKVTERRPKNAFFRPAVNLSRFVRCPQMMFCQCPGANCL